MTETALEKVVRLASVRPYEREERGREENVRGYISPEKWREGQQEWEQRGEEARHRNWWQREVKPVPPGGRKWGVHVITGDVGDPEREIRDLLPKGKFFPGQTVQVMEDGQPTMGSVVHAPDAKPGHVRVATRKQTRDIPEEQVSPWQFKRHWKGAIRQPQLTALAGDLVALATVPVRQFQRVERGREQNVRAHTEVLNHLSDDHDIPEAAWKAGQKEWEQRGEAAWKVAGARYQAMHDQDHRLGTAGHEHAKPITGDQVADALAAKAGRGRVSGRPSMQGMLQRDLAGARGTMENNPLVTGATPRGAGASEHAATGMASAAKEPGQQETVRQTALRGLAAAAVASRNYTEHEVQNVLNDVKQLAEAADKEIEERSKASIVNTIVWALAGVVVSAITGGMGVPLLISIVLGLLPTAAGEIFDKSLVERGHGRQAAVSAHKAVSSAASKAKTTASKAKPSNRKTRLTVAFHVEAAILALAAAGGVTDNSPEAMTREVLYRALLAKGAPDDVAQAMVDGAMEESRRTMMAKRVNERMAKQAMNAKAEPSRIPVDELVRRGHGILHEEPKGPDTQGKQLVVRQAR